jgi:hypothetical protein
VALQPFVRPWPFFSSVILYTESVGLLGRGISPSQGLCLHTGQHKHNKRTYTSVCGVGFKPTTPVFERAKTVHALDRAATVMGDQSSSVPNLTLQCALLPVEGSVTNQHWCEWFSNWRGSMREMRVRKVLSSIPGRETGYLGWNISWLPLNNRLLPNPLEFTIRRRQPPHALASARDMIQKRMIWDEMFNSLRCSRVLCLYIREPCTWC